MNTKTINKHNEAVDSFNLVASNLFNGIPYRTIPSQSGVISNVPQQVYDHSETKAYAPPKVKNSSNNEHLLDFLHSGFDFFHHNFPDMIEKFPDGKVFHYNHCHDNSVAAYHILLNLLQNNDLPQDAPICICMGYISRTIPPGTLIGESMLAYEGLVVHDWHVWNKFNNFIIDLSMSKNGGLLALGSNQDKWQKASDHIFKYPPKNTAYAGIDFESYADYTNFSNLVFGNER